MKFFDQVHIDIESGKWGDGVVAWRREKHVQFWWPSWWDGWKWGDVIFVWDENEWTLMRFRYENKFKASSWDPWWTKQEYGKHWSDLYIAVPVWTVIRDFDSWVIYWSIQSHWDEFLCLSWGKWGVWNMHFTTSTNQYPQIALLGEPNLKKRVTLELQLLADVALIGVPSVWKSTLINAISNTKAKAAEYHFTTLVPNLWVVDHKGKSFHVIDIPGLIEWAADWKWLGNHFLRHIMKSRVLNFLIDASKFENWRNDFLILLQELNKYVALRFYWSQDFGSKVIDVSAWVFFVENCFVWKVSLVLADGNKLVCMNKRILRVISKLDVFADDVELIDEYKVAFWSYLGNLLWCDWSPSYVDHMYAVSAFTRSGVVEWLDKIREYVVQLHADVFDLSLEYKPPSPSPLHETPSSCLDITIEALPRLILNGYLDEDEAETWSTKVWSVLHTGISRLTAVLPRWNDEAELWYWRALEKEWFLDRLRGKWVTRGDIVKIHSVYRNSFKWILWE